MGHCRNKDQLVLGQIAGKAARKRHRWDLALATICREEPALSQIGLQSPILGGCLSPLTSAFRPDRPSCLTAPTRDTPAHRRRPVAHLRVGVSFPRWEPANLVRVSNRYSRAFRRRLESSPFFAGRCNVAAGTFAFWWPDCTCASRYRAVRPVDCSAVGPRRSQQTLQGARHQIARSIQEPRLRSLPADTISA